jgi:hypothetical protein
MSSLLSKTLHILGISALVLTLSALAQAAPINITTGTVPSPATIGVAYPTTTLTATGGTTPYAWTIISGSLPTGLNLSGGGVISGTPASVTGKFSFTVQAADGVPADAGSKAFTIEVSPVITTTSLPSGSIGTAYSQTVAALPTTAGTTLTWTVSAGSLPNGLSINASTGVISGTPTVSGPFNFTVKATDNPGSQSTTASLSITIGSSITITTTTLPPATIGVAYPTTTLTATGGTPPYAWTIISGSLPTGLNLSGGGVISGTPAGVTGNFSFTVQAADGVPADAGSKAFTIEVPPVITTTSLPNGVIGTAYSQTVAALPTTAGTTLTWTVLTGSGGSLPSGLSINASTGVISGTPTATGTFTFTIKATDSPASQSTTASLSITIQPVLTIPAATLPAATTGAFYAQTLVANGPPSPTWLFLSGVLPPGFSISSSGTISGTTTTAGSFTFTVQAATTNPSQTATQSFNIVVNAVLALNIATGSLANGAAGQAYTGAVFASGGTQPYTFSVQAGSLPSGLNMGADGTISGTPDTPGTFNFTVGVKDNSSPPSSASRALSILIQPQLAITTNSPLPLGVVNAFFQLPIAATGPSSLVWTIISGIAPPGLTLTSTGTLGGTPSVAGTFNFTIQVSSTTAPIQTATKAMTMVINPALTITTFSALPNATLGAPYSASLVATGGLGPYTWTVLGAGMPTGFSLSSAGVVTGTPTSPATLSFTAQVSDSFTPVQQATATFVISVGTTVTITTTSLPDAFQNTAYNQQLQASGTAPFFWAVTSGTLPAGIILSQAGLLQGTPTAVGSQTFTVTVTDARNANSSQTFTLTVDPPLPTLSISSLQASLNPTQAAAITMTISAPYPSPLTGQLIMTFSSTAEVPSDDPATQFSSGSRTVSFTIPANTTTASFPSQISLLAGTVAGTITLTANFSNGPSNVPVATTNILLTPPQMTSVTAVRTAAGIDVQIVGYASSRRVTSVEFTFDLKNGTKPDLSESVDAAFGGWYHSTASTPFGSAFSFLQSFNVTGDTTQILDVTVRLTNAQGSTTSAVIKLQ